MNEGGSVGPQPSRWAAPMPGPTSPPPPAVAPPKRRGRLSAALGLVAVLVAGLLAFQFTRSNTEARASLALAFKTGDSTTYTFHMTMNGNVTSDTLGSQPFAMDLSETISWKVTSVDSDGIATIDMTVTDASGTMNGIPVPSAVSGTTMTTRIAPDGRILTADGVQLSGAASTGGVGFPGMGQMTPILPDHPVAPGDSWSKSFSVPFPFGKGSIDYATKSTFDRYENVNGTNAAVVTTNLQVPLDFTLDFGKLSAAFGGTSTSTGGQDLSDAKIAYGGNGAFTITSWLDAADHQLLRSSSTGTFDMTMDFTGAPQAPGTIGMKGSYTLELTTG